MSYQLCSIIRSRRLRNKEKVPTFRNKARDDIVQRINESLTFICDLSACNWESKWRIMIEIDCRLLAIIPKKTVYKGTNSSCRSRGLNSLKTIRYVAKVENQKRQGERDRQRKSIHSYCCWLKSNNRLSNIQ